MIIRGKELYEETSKRNEVPIDLIESIGNYVFNELYYKLNHPSDIAYELPKFGSFNIRFKKFEKYYINFVRQLEANNPDAIKKKEDNIELFNRCTEIYRKIVKYREDRRIKREKRYAEVESNT